MDKRPVDPPEWAYTLKFTVTEDLDLEMLSRAVRQALQIPAIHVQKRLAHIKQVMAEARDEGEQ